MKTLCVLGFVVIFSNVVLGQDVNPYNITRKSLPKLSYAEDLDECLENPDAVFYSVDIELQQDNSPLSQFIQDYALEKSLHYNYSNLHRAICGTRCGLNRTHTVFNETVVNTIKKCLNDSFYNEYGLQVNAISIFYAKTNDEVPITTYDITVAVIVIFIIILNMGVTFYFYLYPIENNEEEDVGFLEESGSEIEANVEADNVETGTQDEPFDCEGKRWMTAFSIQKNWKELNHGGRGEANLFKCIEVLRFYTNFITLVVHSNMILSFGILRNPEYVEDSLTGPKKVTTNFRIVMQILFVISGFLMANKIFAMIENKMFSLRSIRMLSINRYVRIMPTLLMMVALTSTWIPKIGSGAFWERTVTFEGLMCKKNWWHLASLSQNFFPVEKECLPQTWFLGADWQVFHVSLLIILIVWKWPKRGTEILVWTFFISILTSFLQTYFLDLLPIRTSVSPDSVRNNFKDDATIFYGYISPQSNWAGYHIGILTAYLYRKSKTSNWDLKNSPIFKALYTLSGPIIIGCFFMGSDLHHRKVSAFEAATFNSVHQNLFAAAIGILILGNLSKMNGLYASVLESGPLQSLGRLSYCSLLIHTGILRTYSGHQKSGFYASDYNMTMLFAGVFTMTYFLSVILYIFVEAPAYALQRIFLPSKNDKINVNSLATKADSSSTEKESNENSTNESGKKTREIGNGIRNGYEERKVTDGVSMKPNGEVKLSNKNATTDGEKIKCNEIPKDYSLSAGSVKTIARRIDSKKSE